MRKHKLVFGLCITFLCLFCACNQVQQPEIKSNISESLDESSIVSMETEASSETNEETTAPVKDTIYRLEGMSVSEIYDDCRMILILIDSPGMPVTEYYDSLKAYSTTQDLSKELDWTFDYPEPFVDCLVSVDLSGCLYATEDNTLCNIWDNSDSGLWLYTTFTMYVKDEALAKEFYEYVLNVYRTQPETFGYSPEIVDPIIGDFREDTKWHAYTGNPMVGYTPENCDPEHQKPLIQIEPVEMNNQQIWKIQFTTLDI